jgi:broad specificity phosphatase PhoE
MLRVLIIRHGQTAYNKEFRNQGRADIELDDVGLSQANCLAESVSVEGADHIYTSPLLRARRTAEAVAAKIGTTVSVDQRLAERDYGRWEGLTREQIIHIDPEGYEAYRADPIIQPSGGGESGIDVFMRSVAFLSDVFAKHSEGTVLVVAHGGSGSALIAALINAGPATADCFRLSNCSVTEVAIDGTKRRLVRFDDHGHLDAAPLRYPHAGFATK